MTYQHQSIRQKKIAVKQFLIGTSFRFALLGFAAILLTCHVLKMSSISTKGYEISKLQQQIYALEEENQRITIDIARLSSMSYIQEKVKTLQFVPIEKPQHVTFHGNSVARR